MSENLNDLSEHDLHSFGIPDFDEDISDTTDMCRLCMRLKENVSDQEFMDIFSKHPHSNIPISQLFAYGLGIDVHDSISTGMPYKICEGCLNQLHKFTAFKKQALHADTRLRQIATKKQKLAEAQALYGPIFFDVNSVSHYTGNAPSDSLYFASGVDVDGGVPDTCISTLETKTENCMDHMVKDKQLELSSCLEIADIEPTLREECGETNQVSVGAPDESDLVNLEHVKNFRPSHLIGNYSEVVSHGAKEEAPSNRQNLFTSHSNQKIGKVQVQAGDKNLNIRSTNLVSSMKYCSSQSEASDQILNSVDALVEDQSPCVSAGSSKKNPHVRRKDGCRRPAVLLPQIYVVETEGGRKHLSFKCPLCAETFPSRLSFRSHIPSHVKQNGAVCKHCDKWFPTSNAVTRHERIHSGEKPFKCILCDRCFSQKEILQRHILTHSDPKPFQCLQCDKNYTQKEALAAHMRNYHTNYEIIQYQCTLCDKAFCHSSGLSRHMAVHAGKQFVCDTCNRQFHDSSSLRRHIKNQHINSKRR